MASIGTGDGMDMQKVSVGSALAMALLVCSATPTLAQATFKPPEVISAPDIQYPIRSIADGVVFLDVSLDATGGITGVHVVRDIPSLTSAATSSMPSWKFSPASLQGKPEPSTMRIAVAFRPTSYLADGPAFTAVPAQDAPDQTHRGDSLPAILSAAYPQYPVNAAMPGAVIIQVTTETNGAIQRTKVVRELPPFTQFGLNALNHWQFQPATVGGKLVLSNLAIALVFSPLQATE
jgi:outer membrane biosynthesis protein TonB